MNTNYTFAVKIIKEQWYKSKKTDVKKYSLLYQVIKTSIIDLRLPNSWILPSTRVLANQLKLSRTTVIKAYELLQLEKLIVAKLGSGYKITYNSHEESSTKTEMDSNKYPELSERGKLFKDNYSLLNRNTEEYVAFRPGLPPLDVFPVNQWKNLLNNYWRHIKSSSLSYTQASGDFALKESIKNFLYISRNIRCKPEQIIVSSGSLQSLYMISNAILNEADQVVLENPSFPNVHSIFKSLNTRLLPTPLDEEGLDIYSLKENIKSEPKIIHVTPTNHYPLSVRMTLNRRQQLLDYASQKGAIIIENDYEHEVANHKEKLPTLFSLDSENRTVYMGTFNRLLHPSIRLGFMVVPEYLIEVVNAIQEHSHRFVAPSMQVVMNQFIDKSYLYKHLNNINKVAEKRHRLFVKAFAKINSMTIHQEEFCSLHLVAKFKSTDDHKSEKELVKELRDIKITAFPLSKCYITKTSQKGLIFGYAAVNDNLLNKKINQLKKIIP
jgi:GntR family transcriptional regulator/MocR family aminotransferase